MRQHISQQVINSLEIKQDLLNVPTTNTWKSTQKQFLIQSIDYLPQQNAGWVCSAAPVMGTIPAEAEEALKKKEADI